MKAKYRIGIVNTWLILLLVFTSGCYYDVVLPVEPEGEISYSEDMQPFFDLKCIGCHGGIKPNLEVPDSYANLFDGNYIDTLNAANSLLYVKINTGGSMEQYATDTERAKTLKWIEQGAKNN